jgi:hypothetical protein
MRNWRRPRLGVLHFTLALVFLPLGAPIATAVPASGESPTKTAVSPCDSEASVEPLGCAILRGRCGCGRSDRAPADAADPEALGSPPRVGR